MKKTMVFAAVLFSVMLLLPVVTADVYVPPGPIWPWGYMDSWINPYLFVFDTQDMKPIGWYYSDGPMWDPIMQEGMHKIHKSNPAGLWEYPWATEKLDIPWSTEVVIVGFIPGVVVAPDQVPPPVEIVITWNGIPWVVTLELPDDQIVGYEYPPVFYDDIHDTYEFAYPAESPFKDAYYNIWVGDITYIEEMWTGIAFPPEWFETFYGMYNGLFFWYRFHPNVGDWIAWNCQGETKFPPTYDITALFEYSTSQIWFPHVCFDVSLLETHKMIDWTPEGKLSDFVTIHNVGKGPATELDFIQTFPYEPSHLGGHGVILDETWTPKARIDGPTRTVGWTTLPGFAEAMLAGERYDFTGAFSYLDPEETMSIWMQLLVINRDGWVGTIVFDSMVSAHEIPPWKEPIALHSVTIGFVQRFVVLIGDAPAHAAPSGMGWFNVPHAYGGDPGRDEIMGNADDLNYFPMIANLAAQGITVFTVDYGFLWADIFPIYAADAWSNFEYIAGGTGGVHYLGGDSWDTQIANEIQNRVGVVGKADIVFIVDLSASMTNPAVTVDGKLVLDDVKTKAKSLIDSLPFDATFGLGTHVDYPGTYTSYGYGPAQYGSAAAGDYAWLMNLDLTTDIGLVKNTVDLLFTRFGGDDPQDYARVLYEAQFFSWRGPSATDWMPLWFGWKLWWDNGWRFDMIPEWWVPLPILRDKLTHPPPEMTLDPIPVDLNGDGIINAQDVSLVRQAIVGLVAYDLRMDINVNDEIDTADLAAYKLAAK